MTMPVHDWNRVSAGIFHDFHCSWITELKKTLNSEVLPAKYYAVSVQSAGDVVPDVLTLHGGTQEPPPGDGPRGLTARIIGNEW